MSEVKTNKFKELEITLREELKKTGTVKKDGKFTTYRNILYEGYLGDFATEYWTEEDYEEYRKHTKELKEKGTYGKPWICELTLLHYPMYDNNVGLSTKLESYRMVFLDFSK